MPNDPPPTVPDPTPTTAACPTCGAREGEPCVPPNPYPEGSGEHLLYEIFGKREACDAR